MAGIIIDDGFANTLFNRIGQRDTLEENKRQFNEELGLRQRELGQQDRIISQGDAQLAIDGRRVKVMEDESKRAAELLGFQKDELSASADNLRASAGSTRQQTEERQRNVYAEALARAARANQGDTPDKAVPILQGAIERAGGKLSGDETYQELVDQLSRYSLTTDSAGEMGAFVRSLNGSRSAQAPDSAPLANAVQVRTDDYVQILTHQLNTKYKGDPDAMLAEPAVRESMQVFLEAHPTVLATLAGRANVNGENPGVNLVPIGDSGRYVIQVTNKNGKKAPVTRNGTISADNPDDPAVSVSAGDMFNLLQAASTQNGGGIELISPMIDAAAANTADVGYSLDDEAKAAFLAQSALGDDVSNETIMDIATGGPVTGEQKKVAAEARLERATVAEENRGEQRTIAREEREQGRKVEDEDRAFENLDKIENRKFFLRENVRQRATEFDSDLNKLVTDIAAPIIGDSPTFFDEVIGSLGIKGLDANPYEIYRDGANLTDTQRSLLSGEREILNASIEQDVRSVLSDPKQAKLLADELNITVKGRKSNSPGDWSPEDQARAVVAVILSRQNNEDLGTISRKSLQKAIEGTLPRDQGNSEATARPFQGILGLLPSRLLSGNPLTTTGVKE